MKILHLTLKKKWFDMILSGEKKEEYRECKEYWFRRLTKEVSEPIPAIIFRRFDIVRFRNGYAKDAPTFDIECLGISEGYGKRSWGSAGRYVYIIKLGNILQSNAKPLHTKSVTGVRST